MADVFTKAKRSQVMSRIRGRGNKDTELALMRVFRAHRITGWRRQIKLRVAERSTLPKALTPSPSPIRWARVASDSPRSGEGGAFCVRPDFVFPKLRLAVFVDGWWASQALQVSFPN